jgi:hypothetical protein
MSATLFKGPLTGSFVPSTAMLMQGDRVSLDFSLVTVGVTTAVEWYMEFGDTPACGFRETAEEDVAGGVVGMPKVVRTFRENGGALLAAGTSKMTVQFVRKHQFVRLQLRVASGAATATITAPFGTLAT